MGTISHSVPNAEVEPSHHFLTKFSAAGALYGTNGTNQTSGYQSLHGTEIKLIMTQIYEKHSEMLFKWGVENEKANHSLYPSYRQNNGGSDAFLDLTQKAFNLLTDCNISVTEIPNTDC